MFLRIAYVLMALAAIVLSYGIYQAYDTKGAMSRVSAQYAYEPEDGADLTVVEFLDYACEYCQQVHPTIMEAVKKDGKVRYVPRALPTQNKDAMNAFILAHKAAEQGKYIEMHDALMRDFKPIDQAALIDFSNDVGIDGNAMGADIDADAVRARLKENAELFKTFGGNATPLFVIGKDTVYVPEGRMPTVNDFLNMFDQARANQ